MSALPIDVYNRRERETLKKEVIYYNEQMKKNPYEEKIVSSMVNVLVITLPNIKSLSNLRLLRYTQKRLDEYGKWILNLIDDNYKNKGKKLVDDLERLESVKENYIKKIKLLNKILKLAIRHRKDEDEIDINILSGIQETPGRITTGRDIYSQEPPRERTTGGHIYSQETPGSCVETPERTTRSDIYSQETPGVSNPIEIKEMTTRRPRNVNGFYINRLILSLAEYVYRYFRYDTENPITLLESKAFQFQKLIEERDYRINPHDIVAVITAFCQSGKSFLAIPVMLVYLSLGFTPIYVCLDIAQSNQIILRFKKMMNDLKVYLISNHLDSLYDLSMFDDVLFYDSHKPIDDNLCDSLNGEKRRIVVCIKHYKHIKRINELISENSNIVMMCDEAQSSGAFKHKMDEHDNYHDETVQYDNEIAILKSNTKKCIYVSATVQDIIMVSENLYSDNIVYIEPSESYTGIYKTIFEVLEIKDKKDNEKKVLDILQKLSSEEPFERNDLKNNKRDRHPINVLIKFDYGVKEQKKFLEKFPNRDLSDEIIRGDWCGINVTGTNGILLYHSSLVYTPITIGCQTSTLENGIHRFPSGRPNSIDISDAYQYFADLGVDNIPRIFTIAYVLAKEGISFISHYDKPNNYHLTHSIQILSKESSSASALQSISRIFGNHSDDIRPIVYTTDKTRSEVLKGFTTHEKQIKKLLSFSQSGNNICCKEVLKDVIFLEDHIPSNYNAIKECKNDFNKVPNPNKERDKKFLNNRKILGIDALCMLDIELFEDKKERMMRSGDYENMNYNSNDEEDNEDDDEDDDDNCGYKIIRPSRNGKRLETYSKVVKYLKRKNGWIKQSELREHSGISDTREMNDLRGRNETNIVLGSKGLLWRKNGREYEYIFVN